MCLKDSRAARSVYVFIFLCMPSVSCIPDTSCGLKSLSKSVIIMPQHEESSSKWEEDRVLEKAGVEQESSAPATSIFKKL